MSLGVDTIIRRYNTDGNESSKPKKTPGIKVSGADNGSSKPKKTPGIKVSGPPSKEYIETKYEKRLKHCLKLYFYHPFKWLDDGSVSFHFGYCAMFLLQVIKVVLITVMLFSFGRDRSYFNDLVDRGHITLRNLLMKDWDAGWETLPYPPAQGDFAVYDIEDIKERINHAVEKYYSIENEAIGYFTRDDNDNISIAMKYFNFVGFTGQQEDGLTIKDVKLPVDKGLSSLKDGGYVYNVSAEFNYHNLSHPIKKLLSLSLDFTLNSVRVFSKEEEALCLNIKGSLQFSDLDNNGQVIEDLVTLTTKVKCQSIGIKVIDWDLKTRSHALAICVSFFCVISAIATILIVGFAIVLYKLTRDFIGENFKRIYNPMDKKEKNLTFTEYSLFFKLWDLTSITADLLTFGGTISAIHHSGADINVNVGQLDVDMVLLGVGCLFTWFSLLRYFKFHSKFHLLFTTIYRACGDVFAYLICVGVLFIGFWACGYVVLGPYNIKFSTPEAATETLLAVVNGDEIFATLAITDMKKTGDRVIWWFARIYIWAYVALFTIIVLNLLVAIVLNSYEIIKNYYAEKKELRDLGPLEKALHELVDNVKTSDVRKSVLHLLHEDNTISPQEQTFQTELRKLFAIENDDIVPVVPRTLKAFYMDNNNGTDDDKDDTGTCSIIMKFRFPCCRCIES